MLTTIAVISIRAQLWADHMSEDHMDGWGGAWMWLWMVLFWGGLLALVVWAVYRGTSGPRRSSPNEQARELLAERYARGEIDIDEYRKRLEVLRR